MLQEHVTTLKTLLCSVVKCEIDTILYAGAID
jgi:hypothetical protein